MRRFNIVGTALSGTGSSNMNRHSNTWVTVLALQVNTARAPGGTLMLSGVMVTIRFSGGMSGVGDAVGGVVGGVVGGGVVALTIQENEKNFIAFLNYMSK